MRSSVQNNIGFGIDNMNQLRNTVKPQKVGSPSFTSGYERTECGVFRTGGISVRGNAQQLISGSLDKKKLKELMDLLQQTENKRILFCDIYSCSINKRRLKAVFQCSHYINNFQESFKQKLFIESKWEFLMRMLKQFNEYKAQLVRAGAKM